MTPVKDGLLAYVRCPGCGSELRSSGLVKFGPESEGHLECVQCGATYPVRKGIPYLLTGGKLEQTKEREVHGWTSIWQEKGMYDHPSLEDSFRLPYIGGIWTDVARAFDMALQELSLTGSEAILDIGAGQGWASRYFAMRGCQAFAVDIVADDWYGLGRSWAIMEHAGVHFQPVVADGENLPFACGSFDVVFMCGALHHFQNLNPILHQALRVLKPGGRLIAAGEPAISLFTSEREAQSNIEEARLGIIERRPKVHEYWLALRRAGFQSIHIDTFETFNAKPDDIRRWMKAVRQRLLQSVRTRFKPFVWLAIGLLLLLPARLGGSLTLSINGANLFISAVKPRDRSG
ncbi:MAG: methyltransferase domain-containing protein [Anaerolineae bacterium]